MIENRIKQRLIKILALAKRGVGGEKENAERMLNSLLKKHGMTLDDLEDQENRQWRWFKYSSVAERKLLVHCAALAIKGWDYMSKELPNEKAFLTTKAEFIELELFFNVHRPELKKHLKKTQEHALLAYFHANGLLTDNGQKDEENNSSSLTRLEIEAILAMANITKRTVVHKQINAGGL